MTSALAPRPLCAAFLAACLGLGGCASSAAVTAARRGDRRALEHALDVEARAGRLDGAEGRSVARAVFEHDLASQPSDVWAPPVGASHRCAVSFEPALRKRAHRGDEGAARAAYLLVDARLARPSEWGASAGSASAPWRAVAARALRSDSERAGAERRHLFLDLDVMVRRGAIRAAYEARDPSDAGDLLEVVRLDPDPRTRATAALAAGRVSSSDTAIRLVDRYAVADEALREAITSAWGESPAYRLGGRRELLRVAASDQGTPAVRAAAALLAQTRDDPYGASTLADAVASGPVPRRTLAIRVAPLGDARMATAVSKAAADGDPAVRAAALARLTESRPRRTAALTDLSMLAADQRGAPYAAIASLAVARDRRAIPPLERDAREADPRVRAWAAAQLAYMGERARAARLLADPDPSVRAYAACAILRYSSR